jgi:hypothetical protein
MTVDGMAEVTFPNMTSNARINEHRQPRPPLTA